MAVTVLMAPFFSINGVDLSDHTRSITLDYTAKLVDGTAGGATTIVNIASFLEWKADVEFNQDYAAGKVDATMFPLVGAAATAVVIRASTAIKGTANPEFTGTGVVSSYPPISGKVGDMNVTKGTVNCTTALARAIS